jgi:uncharacterized phiE125 gp8 family phage protein
MAVVSHALTTRTKVKSYLGITDSSSDTIIDELINYSTDFIEGLCGRRFLSTTYTNEVYDAKGTSRVFLKNYPITTLSAVEYRAGTPSTPNWVAYQVDNYLLYGKEGFIRFYSQLPFIQQGLRFTYTAGYLIDFTNEGNTTLHTLPFDIAMVATELVAKMHDNKKSQGVTSMTTEGQSVTFASAADFITPAHKSIIGSYSVHTFLI